MNSFNFYGEHLLFGLVLTNEPLNPVGQLGDKWHPNGGFYGTKHVSTPVTPLIEFPICSLYFHPLASLWAAAALCWGCFIIFTLQLLERLRAI